MNDNLKNKLIMYGYKKGNSSMKLTKEILEIAKILVKLPANKEVKEFKCKKIDMMKNTKNFFQKNFNLHEIPITTNEAIIKIVEENQDKIEDSIGIKKIIEQINTSIQLKSSYEIPIKYKEGHSMIGETVKPLIILPDEDYLKNSPIVFSEIALGENVTKLSSITYGHEIAHTQLESVKGYTEDYHNREVISVFLEKVMALDFDNSKRLLQKAELMRFRHLADQIAIVYNSDMYTEEERLESTVYITSTLKAENLFDKYMKSNSQGKKQMLECVQKIFDGKITVENFLEEYNVTLENSSDIKLIKRHL